MNTFQNIFKPTRIMAIFILLLVGFFSLAMAKPVFAASCGAYNNGPTCNDGNYQNLTFYKDAKPPYYSWRCVDRLGGTAYCQAKSTAQCGTYTGTRCLGGQLQNSTTNKSPIYHKWECKDSIGVVAKCNDNTCGNKKADGLDACDGTDFKGKTCEDFGAIDSANCKLKCNPDCTINSTGCSNDGCEASSLCGNGRVDKGEECDGTDLNNKLCEDYGDNYFGGNKLICNDQCNLRADNCSFCGNNKIETYNGKTELCDGTDLGGRTCVDEGFKGGKLTCKKNLLDEALNCTEFDTSLCTSQEDGLAICGNGVIDAFCSGNHLLPCTSNIQCTLGGAGTCSYTPEECDGSAMNMTYDRDNNKEISCGDLGDTNPQTKDNKIMSCTSDCNFVKTNCQIAGGCNHGSTSPSVNLPETNKDEKRPDKNLTSKSCCGVAANQYHEYMPDPKDGHYGLCVGTGTLVPDSFKEEKATDPNADYPSNYNTHNAFWGWTWTCRASDGVETDCVAYHTPECARGVASTNDNCTATLNFKNLSAWNKTWVNRFTTNNKHEFCESGFYVSDRSERCLENDPEWNIYNNAYYCTFTPPNSLNQALGEKKVRCLASWAPPSSCGSLDKKIYKTSTTDESSKDPVVTQFLRLITRDEGIGEFCAPGNKVVLKSKKFEIGEFPGQDLTNTYYNKFTWQCQSDNSAGRKGEIVDCSATLDDSSCKRDNITPMCGPAVSLPLAYEGPGPQDYFCDYGALGGTPYFSDNKVTVTREDRKIDPKTGRMTPTKWSWKCLGYYGSDFHRSIPNGKSVNCSVTASVYCGKASNGAYAKAEDVKRAGACEHGGAAELRDNSMVKSADGNNWEWVCESDSDSSVSTKCTAMVSNRCGYQNGRSYISLSAGEKLCSSGGNSVFTGPVLDKATGVDKWYWKCGEANCSATKLECGTGNKTTYFEGKFIENKNAKATFMCSNGFGNERKVVTTKDMDGKGFVNGQGENIADGFDPGVYWTCEGDSKTLNGKKDILADNACSAKYYGCGYLDHTPVSYSITRDLFAELKGDSTKADAFCTNGSVRIDDPSQKTLSRTNPEDFSTWYCVDPKEKNVAYEDLKNGVTHCAVEHPKCGKLVEKTGGVYYLQTIDTMISRNNTRLLCLPGSLGVGPKKARIDDDKKAPVFDLNDANDYRLWNIKCSDNKTRCSRFDHIYNEDAIPQEFKDDYDSYVYNWLNAKKIGKEKTIKPFELKWKIDPDRGGIAWDCAGTSELTSLYGVNEKKNSLVCNVDRAGCSWIGYPTGDSFYDIFNDVKEQWKIYEKIGNVDSFKEWKKIIAEQGNNPNKYPLCKGAEPNFLTFIDISDQISYGTHALIKLHRQHGWGMDKDDPFGDNHKINHLHGESEWQCSDSTGSTGYFDCGATWLEAYNSDTLK